MNHVLKGSRHLKAASEASFSTPIWISDTLLNETFNRFSRGCKRRGSYIPGPLEARRRATKRKNTSIAYNGAAAAPIDVTGLFGPGKQGGWWKQPRGIESTKQGTSDDAPSLNSLPSGSEEAIPLKSIISWFGKRPAPPVPQIREEEVEIELTEDRLLSRTELKAREITFQEGLSHCSSLDDVRFLIQNQRLASSQAFVFPTLALQHILQAEWSLGAVKDFMLDPVLNPAGAKPLRVIGNALKGRWLDQSMRLGLFDVMCQCVPLGIAAPKELKHIIRSIPRFKMPRNAALVRLGEEPTIHDYYQKVLGAMQESKVVSLQDLGNDFMFTWFKDISSRVFTPAAARLLWKTRRFSGLPEKDLASSLLFRLLRHGLQGENAAVQTTGLDEFLAELPNAILPSVLMRTTQSIVTSSRDGTPSGRSPISRWHDILAGLDHQKVLHIFASKEAWRECLSEPGLGIQRARLLAIAAWVAVSMSTRLRHAKEELRKLGIGRVFQLDLNPGSTRDVLAQFLETLQSLPLTNTSLLLERLRFVTDEYIVAHNEDFISRAIKDDLPQGFLVLQRDQDYNHFRNHFNDVLVDLAQSVNKNLSLFLHVSRYFIAMDESAFQVIVRILKHNLAFHHALSQSRRDRLVEYRADPKAPDELMVEQECRNASMRQRSLLVETGNDALNVLVSKPAQRSTQRPQLEPREVLDLMNHLAVSFATSPVTTWRQAFRRVYWCFKMLHRYGAPIEFPVTRALWHAGITRQGKNGTATTILQWIVQQIRAVEGDSVANMLLRSAGFRQKMEEQFIDLGRLDKEIRRTGTDDKILGKLHELEFIDRKAMMNAPESSVFRERPNQ